MLPAAAALAALALALAVPVPLVLARARWPERAPVAALVLWQAVALAGGLAMVGAPVVAGLAALGPTVPEAVGALVAALGGATLDLPLVSLLAITAGGALAGYLLAHLVSTGVRVGAQRRRHRMLLELLSTPHPTRPATRLLDEPAPLAYCLPRVRGGVTVVSQGLLDALDPEELEAVVAHERAHAVQRHDVVLVAFRAWHAALPGFPIARLAQARVGELVELVADDRAGRDAGRLALASAVDRVAGAGGGQLAATRARRLRIPHPLALPVRAGVVLVAVALVAVPGAALLAPAFG